MSCESPGLVEASKANQIANRTQLDNREKDVRTKKEAARQAKKETSNIQYKPKKGQDDKWKGAIPEHEKFGVLPKRRDSGSCAFLIQESAYDDNRSYVLFSGQDGYEETYGLPSVADKFISVGKASKTFLDEFYLFSPYSSPNNKFSNGVTIYDKFSLPKQTNGLHSVIQRQTSNSILIRIPGLSFGPGNGPPSYYYPGGNGTALGIAQAIANQTIYNQQWYARRYGAEKRRKIQIGALIDKSNLNKTTIAYIYLSNSLYNASTPNSSGGVSSARNELVLEQLDIGSDEYPPTQLNSLDTVYKVTITPENKRNILLTGLLNNSFVNPNEPDSNNIIRGYRSSGREFGDFQIELFSSAYYHQVYSQGPFVGFLCERYGPGPPITITNCEWVGTLEEFRLDGGGGGIRLRYDYVCTSTEIAGPEICESYGEALYKLKVSYTPVLGKIEETQIEIIIT